MNFLRTSEKIPAARIVGVKQLRRALADGRVRKVFLADDADPALTDPIREACTLAGIPVETAASARQLGQACGISVAAAAAGVI